MADPLDELDENDPIYIAILIERERCIKCVEVNTPTPTADNEMWQSILCRIRNQIASGEEYPMNPIEGIYQVFDDLEDDSKADA